MACAWPACPPACLQLASRSVQPPDETPLTAPLLPTPAAGPGAPLFDRRFILHRSHTFLAPHAHVAAGGNAWDTVKPLAPYFARLHRVLLIDDDRCVGGGWVAGARVGSAVAPAAGLPTLAAAIPHECSYKSCAREESNLVVMPPWVRDDPEDRMVPHLVDTLLQLADSLGADPEADVRPHTAAASQRLAALAAEEQAQRAAAQPPEPEPAIEVEAAASTQPAVKEPVACT